MRYKLQSATRIVFRVKDGACNCRSSNYHAIARSRCYSTAHKSSEPQKPVRFSSASFGFSVIVTLGGTAALSYFVPTVHADAKPQKEGIKPQIIRLEEVRKHGRDAESIWVTKGTRVYDITEWIPGHPGGEVILRAAGGAIDNYWNIFTIHKKQDVYDILETFYIGDVDPRDLIDGQVPVEQIDDPFRNDPKRDPRLMVRTARPFNAETSTEELGSFVTSNETFYIRHHMWVPETDELVHKLIIELPNGEEKEYTLHDLRNKFHQLKITATLQCSGNRRRHMTEEARSTNGLQWDVGAISNAQWTGVRLRDVLADCGFPVDDPPDDANHAHFVGAEAYGASIPIEKAIDKRGDVLLAYEMNGEPLPRDHGYPIRVIVPGTVAARSVKWLNRIVISEEESRSQWQRRDYKCFGPNIGGSPDWDSAPSIQELPVQSAITSLRNVLSDSPEDRKLLQVNGLEENSIAVEGYAFSGGGRKIIRVDVSADGGRTWHQAELLPYHSDGKKAWAWTRWRWVIPRHWAGRCFVCKAVDEAYNTQPGDYEPTYNFRGNLTSSWHRVGYRPS